MSQIRIAIAGASGRMGAALLKAIASHENVRLVAAFVRPQSQWLGKEVGQALGLGNVGIYYSAIDKSLECDALIDFTNPEYTIELSHLCAQKGIAHIIGTTGLTDAQTQTIAHNAQKSAVVLSGNMSLGVNLLAALTQKVAQTLDVNFDIEIVETHHNQKVDAPSGTALLLGQAAAKGRGISLAGNTERGRDGITGARKAGAIGFASLRGGTVVGEHTVLFAGPMERIELTHKAEDRSIFAKGALHAAIWASRQKANLYDMQDVLNLK